MSRSLKKAPYVEEKLFNRIQAMNEKGEKKVQNVVSLFDDIPGVCRTYNSRS